MPDAEQTMPRSQTTVNTENAFASPREAVKFVRSLPFVYVLLSAPSDNRHPVIFNFKCTYVFSKNEYAESAVKRIKKAACTIQKLSQVDFAEFVKRCCHYGIPQFVLDDGISGQEAVFSDYDFSIDRSLDLTQDLSRDFALQAHNGAKLNSAILWFLQLRTLPNCSESVKKTAWGNVCYALRNTLFLVPVCYSQRDAELAVDDPEIHLTEKAAKILEYELAKKLSEQNVFSKQTNSESNADLPYRMGGILVGGEHYRCPVNDGQLKVTRNMSVRPFYKNNQPYFPAFTDLPSLLSLCGKNTRIGLYTFEDLVQQTQTAYAAAREVIIDPDDLQLCLHQQNLQAALHFESDMRQLQKQQQLQKLFGKTSKACKQSMVFGILGLVFSVFGGVLFSILAIIYSNRGQAEVAAFGQEGDNKALAGYIMGWLGIVLAFLFSFLYIFLRQKAF